MLEILFLLLLACAGAYLLVLGLRGRRIDYHPLCRRCGFDLTGKPQTSTRCAECGADLAGPRTIRLGNRERQSTLIWLGSTLLLATLSAGGFLSVLAARDVDLHPYMPVWMLISNADAPSVAELESRLVAGKLSDSQIQAVIEAALQAQANPNTGWLAGWGDCFEFALSAGKVSDAQLQRYARGALPLTLAAQPVTRGQRYVTIAVSCQTSRVGGKNTWRVALQAPLPRPQDDFVASANIHGQQGFALTAPVKITQTWLLRDHVIDAPPGQRPLHVEVPVNIYVVPGRGLAAVWLQPLDGTWTITEENRKNLLTTQPNYVR